uniref:AT hook motif-containing protein, putative, expressed n=1 Tax=Tanacetum cinerariifolium TaxID=118510 RepID=A0A6L2NGD0_TANCI|nr:AT hook motif-containing protein, putative, expressed [Tanacetum cinerariifolium]
MHQFWATVNKHNASYQFKIDNKRFSVNVEVFREILNICPKIPEIKYITDVIVDHLHQPWRTFPSIINKCLCGKPAKAKKDVPSTKKPITKPKPTKKKAPVKADRGKCLNVLSEVALSEGAQLKEATKKSKKDFHISQASGLGDETDFESGVPDKQQCKTSGADEGTGTKLGVFDVPIYGSKSDKESWGDSEEEDDDGEVDTEDESDNDGNDDDEEEEYADERVHTLDDYELTDEQKEKIDEEVTKELYKDVNVNVGHEDADMTHDDQGGAEEHNVSQESGFMGQDDKDKDQDPSIGSYRWMKRRKSSKEAESSKDLRSKEGKSSSSSKGTSRSHHKSFGKSSQAEEPSHTVDDSKVRQNQEFDTRNNDEQPADEAAPRKYHRGNVTPTRSTEADNLTIEEQYDFNVALHLSDTYVITMKMEILPVSTSNSTAVFSMMAAARRGQVRFTIACSYLTDIYNDIMKAQCCYIGVRLINYNALCPYPNIPFAMLLHGYMLELDVSDVTTQTVVVLFDEPDDHMGLPLAISNLIGTTHVMEIKSQSYYEYGTFESFTCWQIIPEEDFDVEASGDSSGYVRRNKTDPISDSNKRKRVVTEASSKDVSGLHTQIHPQNSAPYDEMHVEAFVAKCVSHMKGSSNDPMMKSSLLAMLHKTVLITSKTTVCQDRIVHSYCGLKLSDLPTTISGLKDNGSTSTSRYAYTHTSRRPQGVPPACHNLGPPSSRCSKCDATMWYAERTNKAKRAAHPTFSLCCPEGTVPYTFKINGQNYHRMGTLLPAEGVPPRYSQLYFFDTQNEIKNRMFAFMKKETTEKVDEITVAGLIQMLDQSNALARSFRMAKEWCRSHSSEDFSLRLISERTTSRQYNAPTVSEVEALVVNDFGDGIPSRDIVVNKNNEGS